jgi:hypothetical protein
MSTAADRLVKKVRPELEAASAAIAKENIAAADSHLTRALEILRPAAKRFIPKPPPPGKTKAERKEERNERAAEIRAAVMERADGRCEWCHRDGFALEWAHIFGGGERRHREDVTNTAANCWDCHRGWENAKPATFADAKAWARAYGFREALREIEHREALALASPTNKHRRVG